jgi:hypothetical protein
MLNIDARNKGGVSIFNPVSLHDADSETPASLEKSEIEQRLLALELRVSQIELCRQSSSETIARF